MKTKELYKLTKGKITKDGHTMFEDDIVKDLNGWRDSCRKFRNKNAELLKEKGKLMKMFDDYNEKINTKVWELNSKVFSFLEAIETNWELFCDCDGLANEGTCHQEDCMAVAFNKDLNSVEEVISSKREEINKLSKEVLGE